MQNLLLFQVIGRQFGIRMPLVKNVQNTDKYQPRQSDNILPLTLLVDGKKIPLHDLSIIFSSQSSSIDNFTTKKILLTEDDKGLFAFIIDRIDGVVAVSEDKIGLLPPIFNGPARNCFPEVLKTEENLVLLISPKNLENQFSRLKEGILNMQAIEAVAIFSKSDKQLYEVKYSKGDKKYIDEHGQSTGPLPTEIVYGYGKSVEKTIENIVDSAKLERMLSHSIANIVNSRMKVIFNHAFSEVGTQI